MSDIPVVSFVTATIELPAMSSTKTSENRIQQLGLFLHKTLSAFMSFKSLVLSENRTVSLLLDSNIPRVSESTASTSSGLSEFCSVMFVNMSVATLTVSVKFKRMCPSLRSNKSKYTNSGGVVSGT